MFNDDLWEKAGHPGSIDNDLVKASQDVSISREELDIKSPDEEGLKIISEGLDNTFIFKDSTFRIFIITIIGIVIGIILSKLIMMILE